MTMLIFVPNAIGGLKALVEGLAHYTIEDIRKNINNDKIELYLPKFTIESTLSLNEPLSQVTSIH